MFIDGEIADGGGDLTVVSFVPFDVTVEFDVDSVTIGSALATLTITNVSAQRLIASLFIISLTLLTSLTRRLIIF